MVLDCSCRSALLGLVLVALLLGLLLLGLVLLVHARESELLDSICNSEENFIVT